MYLFMKGKNQNVGIVKKRRTKFWERFMILSAALFFSAFFAAIWLPKLQYQSRESRLSEEVICSDLFRRQSVPDDIFEKIKQSDDPGKILGLYWLESDFGTQDVYSDMRKAEKRWSHLEGWQSYLETCRAVWNDLEYFPVAEYEAERLNVTFSDSWMLDRTYQGNRKHEGTDIMPSVNQPNLFPVVSMTDGTVTSVGWLELGGYRIGITAPQGAYFYYAHLSSYTGFKEGDSIHAGDVIGFMGDTGYSKEEGTTGKFPVHLHLGIYLWKDGKEISVNPYAPLKYVEDRKIKARLNK